MNYISNLVNEFCDSKDKVSENDKYEELLREFFESDENMDFEKFIKMKKLDRKERKKLSKYLGRNFFNKGVNNAKF